MAKRGRPRKNQVPESDMHLSLLVTGWRGALGAGLKNDYGKVQRDVWISLALLAELPIGWKPNRRLEINLDREPLLMERAEADGLGVLLGSKAGWHGTVYLTAQEWDAVVPAIVTGRAWQIGLGITKPHYRSAVVRRVWLEAGSSSAVLSPLEDI